ncbi:hypothetical protein ACWGS9_15460 [Bradyrhizobium sp. Arg314]
MIAQIARQFFPINQRVRSMRRMVKVLLFSTLALGAEAQGLQQPLTLGPFLRVEKIEGVDVSVPYTVAVSQTKTSVETRIDATVVADLNDIAAKIGPILAALPLPRDNCRSFSATNPVVSLDRSTLGYQFGQAVLELTGSIVLWACVENPVHKTKLDMQVKDIGFGVKTKVPVVVDMGPGDPTKTTIGSQPFEATLPATLVVPQANSIALQFGRPDIKLGGQYASITNGVLSLAGIDINAEAGKALQRAINPDDLRQAVPSIEGIEPKASPAQFVEKEGHLAAQIEVSAVVDGSAALKLFKALIAAILKGH